MNVCGVPWPVVLVVTDAAGGAQLASEALH